MKIYIIGTQSSFITEAIEICESAGYEEIICIDNLNNFSKKEIDGYPVLHLSQIAKSSSPLPYICCLHTPLFKEHIVSSVKSMPFTPVQVVSSTTTISKRAGISKKGVLIAAHCVVGSHTNVADYVLINRGAQIGHDIEIAPYTTIESGVILNGFCKIGEKSYIGAGAIVLPKVIIGKNCMVAAGAVVRENVPDNCMVAGIPAVIKKDHIKGYIGSIE